MERARTTVESSKAGRFWISRKAKEEIFTITEEITSLSDTVEEKTKWIFNKLKDKMSLSSVNNSNIGSLKFVNKKCRCGRRAAVKISEFKHYQNKLYYCCQDKKCGYFSWCEPMDEPKGLSVTRDPPRDNLMTVVSEISPELQQLKEEVCSLNNRLKQLENFIGTLKIVGHIAIGLFFVIIALLIVKDW